MLAELLVAVIIPPIHTGFEVIPSERPSFHLCKNAFYSSSEATMRLYHLKASFPLECLPMCIP